MSGAEEAGIIVNNTDQRQRSSWWVFLAVAIPLMTLYLLTANWSQPYHLDPFMNVQTGYEIGRFGDPYLSEDAAVLPEDPDLRGQWSRPIGDEYVSQYPPGAALVVAPLYAVWPGNARIEQLYVSKVERDIRVPPLQPAAIVSAIVAAVAMGLIGIASNRITSTGRAVAAGLILGLGTATWSVASHQLWQHGPAMLWIAAGIVLSVGHPFGSGVAFGMAAVTRPHAVLVGLSVAGFRWMSERKLWPAVGTAVLVVSGVVAVIWYNSVVFEGASLSGGYGQSMINRLVSLDNPGWYVGNIWGALFDPVRGLVVYSPFLLLLVPGVPAAWRDSPWWVRGAAVGGVAYLLVQLKANRYSGGSGFFSYRYPLEALTAAAPLLVLSYDRWVADRRWMKAVFVAACAYAVILQAYGVMFTNP